MALAQGIQAVTAGYHAYLQTTKSKGTATAYYVHVDWVAHDGLSAGIRCSNATGIVSLLQQAAIDQAPDRGGLLSAVSMTSGSDVITLSVAADQATTPLPRSASSGLTVEKDFVLDANPNGAQGKTKLTDKFDVWEYFDVFPKKASTPPPFRLLISLATSVQQIAFSYKAGKGKGAVTIVDVGADGLSVTLGCGGSIDVLRKAVAATKADLTVAELRYPGWIRLTAKEPPPGKRGGAAAIKFSAASAFGAIIKESGVGPSDRLFVRFRLVFPNGGPLCAPFLAGASPGDVVTVDPDKIKSDCPSRLEAVAEHYQGPLRRACLEEMKIQTLGTVETVHFPICVPFAGPIADFVNAKPEIYLLSDPSDPSKDKPLKAKVNRDTACLVADYAAPSWTLDSSTLTFEARVPKGSVFNDLKMDVAPVRASIDRKAELSNLEIDWESEPDTIVVRVKAVCFPSNYNLELTVSKDGSPIDEIGKAARFNPTALQKKGTQPNATHRGFCEPDGTVVIRVSRVLPKKSEKMFNKCFSSGDSVTFKVFWPFRPALAIESTETVP